MALPILDGNQSATTLSTIVTGGQHIPAHTVISLGSQAITDMRSAVSGSVVSISNFPATQPVSGTVTAQSWFAPQGQLGTANIISDGGGTACDLGVQIGFNNASAQEFTLVDTSNPLPIAGTVTLSEFVSVESSQEKLIGTTGGNPLNAGVGISFNLGGASSIVGTSNPLPISGTVTANVGNVSDIVGAGYVHFAELLSSETIFIARDNSNDLTNLKTDASKNLLISGTVTLGASSVTFNSFVGQRGDGSWQPISLQSGSNYVNANIPGSITVGAMPSGALTTRFGSVTTANTAQLTSAVTNTSRKYLLVQNIATSTVTIGIGFAPTTTQGIQLTAGAGLTFDAFCPTGGVWWLSSTTGSNFSILEG